MAMDPRLMPGDATLIENIVNYLKAKGIFDEFRHESLADVDTKSSCQNLSQRVDGYTSKFLANETWHPDLNKNELRNKLRRNIDESGMLAVGADHVVEQVINPKIHQFFLPKIIEVVHQYVKEQTELLSKKPEPSSSTDNVSFSEKSSGEVSENKDKTSISDPIADILSFSYSKSKPTSSTNVKSENVQHKLVEKKKDIDKKKEEKSFLTTDKSSSEIPCEKKKEVDKKKEEKSLPMTDKSSSEIPSEKRKEVDKKKEEKSLPMTDKSSSEIPCEKKKEVDKKKEEKLVPTTEKISSEISYENQVASVVTDTKPLIEKEKEKSKKDDTDISQETVKKFEKDESKPEDKKNENLKPSGSESNTPVEENKLNTSTSNKPALLSKKESNRIKHKSSAVSTNKTTSSSSEVKKHKKESSDKSSEKHAKSKPIKSSKESTSPTKSSTLSKSSSKEEKESSKSKSHDSSSSKTSDSSLKKHKSSSKHKDNSVSKHKYSEKSDKSKTSKSLDKTDLNAQLDSSNSEKGSKNIHYSSSYDSSQGSDQEKSSSSVSKKERQKHFSKHLEKGKTKDSNGDNKASSDKKKTKEDDESPSKVLKNEKDSKLKIKDTTVVEAEKISSRSNSFGSTSSVSSSSNSSKENSVTNPDEVPESSAKDKKKKQLKEKDSCQSPFKPLPPPPPPPPPTSLTSSEVTSSAEMSSVEDTQSSSDNETSSSEEISDESSDSELESKDLINNTLNESKLNSSTDSINAFYDIFLYSSSSSEFEGYASSPEKKNASDEKLKSKPNYESDLSISSVHTSDLSSYDDEVSDDDDDNSISFLTGGLKTKLSLKEAQELIEKRAALLQDNKMINTKDDADPINTSFCTPQKRSQQRSSSFLSSDDESFPAEPRRSLRRERKLNPRYASSEYTSIFNSKKESFITKQSSPSLKSNFSTSPSNMENKSKKTDSPIENVKVPKTSLLENELETPDRDIEMSTKNVNTLESRDELDEVSSSDEIETITSKEKIFQDTDKLNKVPDPDNFGTCMKLKPQNNSKLSRNLCSLKRKLEVPESSPVKRPCSRSSIDSSSSEFVPNENKPFNSEKQDFEEEKLLRDCKLKNSDLAQGFKKDLFCKQRTNNNGDILGQKDIFTKNSHMKGLSNPEKKSSDTDISKELNSL